MPRMGHGTGCLALWLRLVSVACVIRTGWALRDLWFEDFGPCSGSCKNGINTNVWFFELGDGTKYDNPGWGNNEAQCYTDAAANAQVLLKSGSSTDGILYITAKREKSSFRCINPGPPPFPARHHPRGRHQRANSRKPYSSARLTTRNARAFVWTDTTHPIKVEARMKLPNDAATTLGTWPAFWMLPDTTRTACLGCSNYGDAWCTGGEIDVMERINLQTTVNGNAFWGGGGYSGGVQYDWIGCQSRTGSIDVTTTGASMNDWFQTSVIWYADRIEYYFNGNKYHTIYSTEYWSWGTSRPGWAVPDPDGNAPFDRPFYLLLNMAVGGNWPTADGTAIGSWSTSGSYMIDWIRVTELTCGTDLTC